MPIRILCINNGGKDYYNFLLTNINPESTLHYLLESIYKAFKIIVSIIIYSYFLEL